MTKHEDLDLLPLPLIQEIINAPIDSRFYDHELPPSVIIRKEGINDDEIGFGVNECLLRMAQEIEYYRSKK